ncbi:hypothetical protein BD413DRAFT_61713 [Trametes elegans]|nr:hypothetical protein BD413DRAFT_61713 [Trametes elegans]
MNNADQFLQVIPRTLHSLAIGERIGTEEVFESDKYEALAEFTALAHLSLETRYGIDEPEWMAELLSRIRCTTVESVELKYWMIAAKTIDQMIGEAQLGAIDAVLSREPFTNLGYLNIFFSFTAHGYEEEQKILDALSEHVAKSTAGCSARGVHVAITLGTEFSNQP